MAHSLSKISSTTSFFQPTPRHWIAFRVTHKAGPSWTVVDRFTFELHPQASPYLHYLFGAARSTNTIRAYAQRLASFFTWLGPTGLKWQDGMPVASRFIRELSTTQLPFSANGAEYREPRFRSGKTVNQYAAAITQFYMWAARADLVSDKTAAGFYETRIAYGFTHDRLLPGQVIRSRAVRVQEVEEAPKVLDATAVHSLLEKAGNHRDRFLVALLLETGMRIGEALGLRTEDLHFFHDSRSLGCRTPGPHVHIRRRRNLNSALSKSVRPRTVPVTATVCTLYHLYLEDRIDLLALDPSPMVLTWLGILPRPAGSAPAFPRATSRNCSDTGAPRPNRSMSMPPIKTSATQLKACVTVHGAHRDCRAINPRRRCSSTFRSSGARRPCRGSDEFPVIACQ